MYGTIKVKREGIYEGSDGELHHLNSLEKYDADGNLLDGGALELNPKGPNESGFGEFEAQETNPPVMPETPQEKSGWGSFWDSASPWVHGTLDVVGFVPVIGDIVGDGGNAIIYLAEGNMVDAGIATGAMIPVAGWAVTAGKYIKKGVKYGPEIVQGVKKGADFVKKYGEKALDSGKKLASRASKWADEAAGSLKKRWDDFWGKKPDAPKPKKKKPDGDGNDGAKITQKSKTQPSGKKGGKPTGDRTPESGSQKHQHMRENQSADILADNGYKVEQNPGTLPNGKNPDYKDEPRKQWNRAWI
jgi:hypothetical protein